MVAQLVRPLLALSLRSVLSPRQGNHGATTVRLFMQAYRVVVAREQQESATMQGSSPPCMVI